MRFSRALVLVVTMIVLPGSAAFAMPNDAQPAADEARTAESQPQQTNVPPAVQDAEETVEDVVERFRIGVTGGAAVDPELIMLGAHATFAPVFHRRVEFRPGLEIGLGELTTLLAINLDVVYAMPGATRATRWTPYIGAGPTFGLSHRGFETDDVDNVDIGVPIDSRNRFDFSDTDFNGGMNFIAGARSRGGLFFELKATAWGVSNIRLLAGYNF